MKAWNEAFAKHHPGVVINLVMRDVAPEERIALGPNTEEVFHADDSAYDNKYGYAPFRIRICQGAFVLKSHVSAIGVFVSKDNPLDEIPLDKLDAIYSDARRRGYPADITTWGQLGLTGEWADKPIHIGQYGVDANRMPVAELSAVPENWHVHVPRPLPACCQAAELRLPEHW